ncbi:MAG: hypothetical protein RRA15_00385 [bacterium]|nr:hypothetical protein [bacterium]MDT8364932.1 hypothetical protein [bacterium]
MSNLKPETRNLKPRPWSLRLISIWFAVQVLFNVITAIYLALHPLDEPVSWFERLDLTGNTGINAALAIGLWRRTMWAWSTAVWLVSLY